MIRRYVTYAQYKFIAQHRWKEVAYMEAYNRVVTCVFRIPNPPGDWSTED